jgi:TRAP-type mannitol/chloroaromatic compound transport system permease large subunit
MTENRYLIMLIMVLIFMIAGCVMETTPNIVILAPILLPLALEIGMNEIHFCIIMITSLGIGFITPPRNASAFNIALRSLFCFYHAADSHHSHADTGAVTLVDLGSFDMVRLLEIHFRELAVFPVKFLYKTHRQSRKICASSLTS